MVLEILAITIKQGKEIDDIKIEWEEIKFSLFVDHIIFYITNPKDSPPKLLEYII